MSGGIDTSDFQSLPFGSIEDPITYVSFTVYHVNLSVIQVPVSYLRDTINICVNMMLLQLLLCA